ncbi:hypothetical protein DFH94DRAFT_742758 [Russula ochroleuca]|jgi:hypothetical protein|uniref:SnoaL-like domain-containing protein n=1 Tax=Russula ochroleuca TaxID=152965 RepID=A0A9P5MWG9_9AGAM|nr:hypothetical protein DFH94DRAFT_742758 [Russula ochroleuca]
MSPQPYVFPESPSPQLKVVQDYIKFFSAFDLEKLGTLISDNLVHKIVPESLGVPNRTKAEILAFLAHMRGMFNGKPLEITVYDINEGVGKIWLHGKIAEPLDGEGVYLFEFGVGPDALKITSFTEFADSKRYLELAQRLLPTN